MGEQANYDQSKGLMECFGAQHLSNSKTPLGAFCIPGSGPQQDIQVLFGCLGDRLEIVTRNTRFCVFMLRG